MDIDLGGKTISVNLDDMESLSDLTKAINGDKDNPGVTASPDPHRRQRDADVKQR